MPPWTQHLVVLLLVGSAVAYLLFGLIKTFTGRRSSLGNCCAKGCPPQKSPDEKQAPKTAFIPSELLTIRRR